MSADEDLSLPKVSVKSVISACISNSSEEGFIFDEAVSLENILTDTAEFIFLADNRKEIRRVISWLDIVAGADQYKKKLTALLISKKCTSTRSAKILITTLFELGTFELISSKDMERLIACLTLEDLNYLPKSNKLQNVRVEGEPSLSKVKLAAYLQCNLETEFMATLLSDFKGSVDDLRDLLRWVKLCRFDKNGVALKNVLDRMFLRSSVNACIVVSELKVLGLVSDKVVELISNETDSVREVALEALKSNIMYEPIINSLVGAFNKKGVVLKGKLAIAKALTFGPATNESTALALDVITKETNEQLVTALLPLVKDNPSVFSNLKSTKPAMRAVLVRGMGSSVLPGFASVLYELVRNESCPSTADSISLVCAALGKLSSSGLDWSKFLSESEAKPASIFRAILSYPVEAQHDIIPWLLAYPKPEPAIGRVLASMAIQGSTIIRKTIISQLRKMESHQIDIPAVVEVLDSSLNSWKLCKALVKTEKQALQVFNVCHVLGHDWVCLATQVIKDVTRMIVEHFESICNIKTLNVAALATLEKFARGQLNTTARSFIDDALKRAEDIMLSESASRIEKIWNHPDDSTPTNPLRKISSAGSKPDPKAEKAALEEQLLEEKRVRNTISAILDDLDRAIVLSAFASCEEWGPRAVLGLDSSIFKAHVVRLLYGLAKGWRPLVASATIRSKLKSEQLVDPNWNIPDESSMAESILRLFERKRPLEAATVYCFPFFAEHLGEDQFCTALTDRIHDLANILNDIDLVIQYRYCLLPDLLGGRASLEAGRLLLAAIGGPISTAQEVNLMLDSLYSENVSCRRLAIAALHEASWSLSGLEEQTVRRFHMVIDLLRYEESCMQDATAVALKLRDSSSAAVMMRPEEEMKEICALLESKPSESWVQEAAKEAVAAIDGSVASEALLRAYDQLLENRRPALINVRSKDLDLTEFGRAAIIDAMGMVQQQSDADNGNFLVERLFRPLINRVFFDPAPKCQELALQSAVALLEGIPAERMERLGPLLGSLFEASISRTSDVGVSVEAQDRVRVFVIILLGRVSQWLSQDASRRTSLIASMLETLRTPSESVQCAVAEAMVPLFSSPLHHGNAAALAKDLLDQVLLPDSKLAVRRGAAYGLAALGKARGLRCVREWSLLDALLDRIGKTKGKDAAPAEVREGAIFTLELLGRFFGPAFEPYVMHTIDALLTGFSDGRAEVRAAAIDAARSLMGCVSSAGSRLLLPALLKRCSSEEGSNWRSRVGVLEWLGAMASLAPSVLAPRLPQIIPVLIETGLNDSHGEVQATARRALLEYGKRAVQNPEVRSLIPSIMEALADPSGATLSCFKKILNTRFVHIIDGPSLSLLEPLLRRALTDRTSSGATLKRLAGQIIGNLATSLVDAEAFGPYLASLVPALCGCLGDPVPQVRAHAAKVLGMLVGVAELDGRASSLAAVGPVFPQLRTSLLAASTGDIDRTGAAQALAEIMAAKAKGGDVDFSRVEIGTLSAEWLGSPSAVHREAALLLLGYLPGAFDFNQRLEALYQETGLRQLLPAILARNADGSEAVRTAAGRTSRALVETLVAADIDRAGLFSALLAGLGAGQWRTRLACLEMVEKALTVEADESGEVSDDTQTGRLPTASELLSSGLLVDGQDGVRLLLSRLYLSRYDPASSQLRATGLNLWKALAPHSPRALADILPVLVKECVRIQGTSHENPDGEREADEETTGDGSAAIRPALEDLFVRVGDRLAVPFLKECLTLSLEDSRSNAAMLIMSICVSALGAQPDMLTRSGLEEAQALLVKAVSHGLAQDAPAAGHLLDCILARLPGVQSAEQAVPLLRQIISAFPDSDRVALRLLPSQPAALLAFLVPEAQQGLPNAAALHRLADIFSIAGYASLSYAVPACKAILAACTQMDEPVELALSAIFTSLNLEDDEQDTVHHLRLWQLMEAQAEERPAWAFDLVRLYCQSCPGLDHGRLYTAWLPRLVPAALGGADPSSTSAADALTALLGSAKPEQVASLVQLLRSPVARLASSKQTALSSAAAPLLTLLVKSVLLPSLNISQAAAADHEAEMARVYACEVASALLRLSSASTAWGSSALTLLVGALIRVASEQRKSRESRPAALGTLLEALKAHPTALRPFFPQLQRLLPQAIQGVTPEVSSEDLQARDLAVPALALLLPLLPRPEAIIQQWAAILALPSIDDDDEEDAVQHGEDLPVYSAAKPAMLRCLAAALISAPSQLGPKLIELRQPFVQLSRLLAAHPIEAIRLANAELISALAAASVISPEDKASLFQLSAMLK